MIDSSMDFIFMKQALALAKGATRLASPNPGVGCVLVNDQRIIGEGSTCEVGSDHAEIQAIKNCILSGYSPAGATAYLTLEPCSHYGRTPPCALKLIEVGIKKAVIAIQDPFPLVSGRGIALLKEAGIEVLLGILKNEALEVHRGFLSRISRGYPWVTLKMASSLDGRAALLNRESKWITGEEARKDVQFLRAQHCAILTGSGTVIADNPKLTVRDIIAPQPKRFVIDGRLKTLVSSAIYSDANTHIFSIESNKDNIDFYLKHNIQVTTVDAVNGHVNLKTVLKKLGDSGVNNLLVETGPGLAGAMVKNSLVDEVVMYMAPSYLGDKAIGIFTWNEIISLEQSVRFRIHNTAMIGNDLKIICRFNNS